MWIIALDGIERAGWKDVLLKDGRIKENLRARRGGNVANTAKQAYEEQLGQKVVSPLNAQNKQMLEIKNDDN